MEPDWDLHAVVRGFAAINKSETNAAASAFTADVDHSRSSGAEASYYTGVKQTEVEKHHGFCSTNLAVAEEFRELCTPTCLLDRRQTQFVQPTISSYLAALQAYKKRTQQQTKGSHLYGTTSASSAAATKTNPKPKRRKNHQKKICHVPAEALSSDIWSWRKYGQKPIKGSPYPRSYYKCSSSKACLARKQVERNRSDPNMFIVTYTAEHNHPAPTHKNSLAGTTRNPNSLSSLSAIAHDESNLPTSKPSSTNSTATMSPEGSLGDEVLQQSKETESMDVDTGGDMNRTNLVDDVMEFWDMDVSENFVGDPDDISGPSMDCFFPDEFLASFPWDC